MITIESIDGFVVAHVRGDVDMANTHEIESAIAMNVTSEDRGFVIDLTDVTYLDSSGVRLLYQLDERASGRQQQVVIVIPPGAPANRTLEVSGALGSLKIVSTTDEAVDVLAG